NFSIAAVNVSIRASSCSAITASFRRSLPSSPQHRARDVPYRIELDCADSVRPNVVGCRKCNLARTRQSQLASRSHEDHEIHFVTPVLNHRGHVTRARLINQEWATK